MLFPQPQSITMQQGSITLSKIKWIFGENTDSRVINEAFEICNDCENGVNVKIVHGDENDESYRIIITEQEVTLFSNGAAGAFYALQTLKQLIAENCGKVPAQIIDDKPDLKYRGFYQDATRGRVPTLEALKSLVDTLAMYKYNSLQLYIEHTFEFPEYDFCRQLGYLTEEEVKQLDSYCKSKFIELVPSVACFGHLYHLLQSDKYKHLSELHDYQPTSHYWAERMLHHTINPKLDESFELITSLINRFIAVTTSDKFNICCDETIDLATDVNKGEDKAKLYFDFVNKLIHHLTAKGKKVMMWGDIVLHHYDKLPQLPENVVFLNWNYSETAGCDQFEKIYKSGRPQILCPGTRAWNFFSEYVYAEELNISLLAKYAHRYLACGLLVTNWGDYGHLASAAMTSYGLMLGAIFSWNKNATLSPALRRSCSEAIFGNEKILDIMYQFRDVILTVNWQKFVTGKSEPMWGEKENPTEQRYAEVLSRLQDILDTLSSESYKDETIKRETVIATKGYIITVIGCATVDGYSFKPKFDAADWLNSYSEMRLAESKPSELGELQKIVKMRLGLE